MTGRWGCFLWHPYSEFKQKFSKIQYKQSFKQYITYDFDLQIQILDLGGNFLCGAK